MVTRRRATTTVTVMDGQTVVIGGLISDRFERVDTKIPLLGDIPLLGVLFRQFKESSSKTELLIVLTPHVIRSPSSGGIDRAKEITESQLNKLTLPAALLDQIRKGELQGVQTKTSSGSATDLKKIPETDDGAGPKLGPTDEAASPSPATATPVTTPTTTPATTPSSAGVVQ